MNTYLSYMSEEIIEEYIEDTIYQELDEDEFDKVITENI